jgi:hypothetical protein
LRKLHAPETVYDFSDGAMRERIVVQHDDVNLRPLNPQDRDFPQADPPCRPGERNGSWLVSVSMPISA